MYTDPIADYLTRVRNAVAANHKVEIPASNLKKEITKILFDQGYILSYKFEDNAVQGSIKIALKYDKDTKESVRDIQRISKPGLRKYSSSSTIPRILIRYCYCFHIERFDDWKESKTIKCWW
jgi:small subunit ribosomal protein S8